MIQFVVYEHLRQRLENPKTSSSGANFTKFMIAGAISKFVACIMVYPHGLIS
jgi:hypothetical protein